MLKVQINGSWVAADPATIAEMVLDGRLNRSTLAIDQTRADAEGPLERFLAQPHFEELGSQILDRLRSMYRTGSVGRNPVEIRARVEELCAWNWSDPVLRGRLLWVAGWLGELTGLFERAVHYYNAFLQQRSPEARLRILAYNNRGVLRIRLGQVEGVRDLARAAMLMDRDQHESRQPVKLPAACFNLLNLLNLAVQYDALCDEVETVLVDFMVRLPQKVREGWLGTDPIKKEDKLNKGPGVDPAGQARGRESTGVEETTRGESPGEPEAAPQSQSGSSGAKDDEADLRKRLLILRDPRFERLNRLASELATEAQKIAPEQKGVDDCVKQQLCLWSPRPETDVAGDSPGREPRQPMRRVRHEEYAEAASLLYARHIPSSLAPQEYSVLWAERLAQESLTRSQRYLAVEDYNLARSTLKAAREALGRSKGGRRVRVIRRRVDRQLRLVEQRQSAHEQLQLHQTCTEIGNNVDQFCTLTNLCQAQRESETLKRQLDQLKRDLQRIWGKESVCLLDDQAKRIEGHLRELERRDLEAKTQEPLQRLCDQWPADWRNPVPDAAYEALAECRLKDPDGRVEDWELKKLQLDHHQAKYHLDRAIRNVSTAEFDRKQVEGGLALALSLNPNLGPAAAPLFGLMELPPASSMPGDLTEIRTALLDTARRLLQEQPMGADGVWSSAVRADLIRQACSLLKRLFHAFQGVGGEFISLWRALEGGFKTALAESRPEIAGEIEQMIRACLDACPLIAGGMAAPSDPRNPLQVLLEKCQRAKLLGHGEAALNAKDPQLDAAAEYFRQALGSGLGCDQLRRAAVGLYLASIGTEDPAELQRKTLDALEAWVNQVPADQCERIRDTDIAERVSVIQREVGTAVESKGPTPQPDGSGGEVVGGQVGPTEEPVDAASAGSEGPGSEDAEIGSDGGTDDQPADGQNAADQKVE